MNTLKTIKNLYIKIYCNSRGSDYLISKLNESIINEFQYIVSSDILKYVDYSGFHIRLRVNISIEHYYFVLEKTEHILNDLKYKNYIFSYLYDKYNYDLNKYNKYEMVDILKIFDYDTKILIKSIDYKYNKFQFIKYYILKKLGWFSNDKKVWLTLVKEHIRIYNLLSMKNQITKQKIHKKNNTFFIIDPIFNSYETMLRESQLVTNNFLFHDTVHLFINRFFNKNPKAIEYAVFYYLQKDINYEIHK